MSEQGNRIAKAFMSTLFYRLKMSNKEVRKKRERTRDVRQTETEVVEEQPSHTSPSFSTPSFYDNLNSLGSKVVLYRAATCSRKLKKRLNEKLSQGLVLH